jgi:hypothetical protein
MRESDMHADVRSAPSTDRAYDLRTHLTDATLAAVVLRHTDRNGDNPRRKRVYRLLQHAHEALRDDLKHMDTADHDERN